MRAEHGSKDKLAATVLKSLEVPDGEEREAFEGRIKTLSNAKLLRLLDAQKTLTDTYGSKADLVEKIVAAKFKGGNDPYATKLGKMTLTRLLDLARQLKI